MSQGIEKTVPPAKWGKSLRTTCENMEMATTTRRKATIGKGYSPFLSFIDQANKIAGTSTPKFVMAATSRNLDCL